MPAYDPISGPGWTTEDTDVRIPWTRWLPFPWRTVTVSTSLAITEARTTACSRLLRKQRDVRRPCRDVGRPGVLPVITRRHEPKRP